MKKVLQVWQEGKLLVFKRGESQSVYEIKVSGRAELTNGDIGEIVGHCIGYIDDKDCEVIPDVHPYYVIDYVFNEPGSGTISKVETNSKRCHDLK